MAKSSNFGVVGSWAFLIGVLLAVILGALGYASGTWLIVLIIIGLIVGILNITDKEVMPFLLSGAVLIIASSLGGVAVKDIAILNQILAALLAIFVPATIIVAIKNVFSLAKN